MDDSDEDQRPGRVGAGDGRHSLRGEHLGHLSPAAARARSLAAPSSLMWPPDGRLRESHAIAPTRSLGQRVVRASLRLVLAYLAASFLGLTVAPGWIPGAVFWSIVLWRPARSLPGWLRHWQRRRRRLQAQRGLEQAPAAGSLGAVADGAWVRIAGTVLAGPSFTSAGERPASVVASYIGTLGGRKNRPEADPVRGELHAVDFTVRLATGEEVRISPEGAEYLDRTTGIHEVFLQRSPLATRAAISSLGHRRVARIFEEDVIAVGDEVEVHGCLGRQVAATAEGGYRGARLVPVLRSAGDRPLALRARRRAIVPAAK